jgi:hypothetical protein
MSGSLVLLDAAGRRRSPATLPGYLAGRAPRIVLLALGIAGSRNLPVVAPLVSLGAFILGADGAGVVAKRLEGAGSRSLPRARDRGITARADSPPDRGNDALR